MTKAILVSQISLNCNVITYMREICWIFAIKISELNFHEMRRNSSIFV